MAQSNTLRLVCNPDYYSNKFVNFDDLKFVQMMTAPASKESDEYELREAFKCIDLDGNGYISRDELKKIVLQTMHSETDEKEIDEMMNEADLDGDGFIDYDEFVNILVEKRS